MNYKRFKLYHYPASRSARVKWILHEVLDDAFDVEVLALFEGEQYSPEFLAKNPNHNVPVLEIALENGESITMLESGAMVTLLADIFPEKSLCPAPGVFSPERVEYLHMLHFGTSWIDMMLWQIRVHTHLLGPEGDAKTITRYEDKFRSEAEPQLLNRLQRHDYICGDQFSAVDCVMGQNILWAQLYGLAQDPMFTSYIERLSSREAFQKAFADMKDFQLGPPGST